MFVCRSARFFVQRNLYIVLKFDASISPLFLQYFFFLFYFLQRVKPTRGRSTFLLHDPFFLSRVHFLSLIPGSSPAYPSIRPDGYPLPFLVPSPSINTHLAINRRLPEALSSTFPNLCLLNGACPKSFFLLHTVCSTRLALLDSHIPIISFSPRRLTILLCSFYIDMYHVTTDFMLIVILCTLDPSS